MTTRTTLLPTTLIGALGVTGVGIWCALGGRSAALGASPRRGIFVEKIPWVHPDDPPDLKKLFKHEKPMLRWRCTSAFRSAQFQERKSPRHTAILHRSTKRKGKWQLTFFEDGNPTSDIQGSSCDELLRELRPNSWRLRRAISEAS